MGFATVAGGGRATTPSAGVKASDLAVGSTVKLMESGSAVEYLVVNQGIPSNSSLYDASCNGTWLLRKEVVSNVRWTNQRNNNYLTSLINTALNGTFFDALGEAEQAVIKQVKIPVVNGTGTANVISGANGFSCKVFLLSGCELGVGATYPDVFPADGAKLSFFEEGISDSANQKRIAKTGQSEASYWLRSCLKNSTIEVFTIVSTGSFSSKRVYYLSNYAPLSDGERPALVLSSDAVFDADTMLLKGVA